MTSLIGRVIEVSGAQLIAALDSQGDPQDATTEGTGVGGLVKMSTAAGRVLGAVSALRIQNGVTDRRVLVIDLLGEVTDDPGGAARFGRGVSVYPQLGTPVVAATAEDADMVYGRPATFHTRIGCLHQDAARPAFLLTDDLWPSTSPSSAAVARASLAP